MAEKLPFLNLFHAYQPDAELAQWLCDVLVLSANIDATARTLDAELEGPYSLGALLPRLESELAAAYRLSGARLNLRPIDEKEPVMWIWSIPEGKEQPCCNHLYFTTNGHVYDVYESLRAAGIDCPEPVKMFWGGVELTVTDPDGNTILIM